MVDDGVHCRGDECNLLNDVLLHEVVKVRILQKRHVGVGLVEPDVHLFARDPPHQVSLLHLDDDLAEVCETHAVRTEHDHRDLARHQLPRKGLDGDLGPTVSATPAEAVALDLRIGIELVVADVEVLVHAGGRLLDEAAVVGLDHEVDAACTSRRKGDGLLLFDHVLNAARFATLAVEREHGALRIEATHFHVLSCGWWDRQKRPPCVSIFICSLKAMMRHPLPLGTIPMRHKKEPLSFILSFICICISLIVSLYAGGAAVSGDTVTMRLVPR